MDQRHGQYNVHKQTKRTMGMTSTTIKVANTYISELTGIHAALATVRAVTILREVSLGSLDTGCDNEHAAYLSSILDTKVRPS